MPTNDIFNQDFEKEYYFPIFKCPLCKLGVQKSEYLDQIFGCDIKTKYLAHLVTHYRHYHITSWNKMWGHNGNKYRGTWFKDYEIAKSRVNEQAKRQLIRKAFPIFIGLGITPEHFQNLQGTTEETLKVANKFLPYADKRDTPFPAQ